MPTSLSGRNSMTIRGIADLFGCFRSSGAYLIDEDNFGLARLMSRPGFSLELESRDGNATAVVFSFFHDTRGMGRVLNPLIKWQQRRNRLETLNSLKSYAEEMAGS